jgi:hypothetical protein
MTTRFNFLELTGWRLDAAVHWAQERLPEEEELLALGLSSLEALYSDDSNVNPNLPRSLLDLRRDRPSRDWAVGGRLIEAESIALEPARGPDALVREWSARIVTQDARRDSLASGSTPLEAAMRAFVYMELGAIVELPL